jgi:hypothetical protein
MHEDKGALAWPLKDCLSLSLSVGWSHKRVLANVAYACATLNTELPLRSRTRSLSYHRFLHLIWSGQSILQRPFTMPESVHAPEQKPLNDKLVIPQHGQVDAEAAHDAFIDPAAEAKLVRKQDLRVLPMVFLMYFFTFLDRTNLGNARIAGMEEDLGLSTFGFNIGACLYYAIYFFADIPASLSVKKYGFIVLPISCISFGIVTLGTAFIRNEASFYAIRLLLGLTESFQFPGLSYVVSRYYRRGEVTTRVSFFMLAAAGLAGGFGGLLASGLLSLGSIGSVSSWRNIFLVEGFVFSQCATVLD